MIIISDLLSLWLFPLVHLIQGGLRHRVVLNVKLLLVGQHHLKDPGQRRGGNLVLQGVVVLLSLDAPGERALHERLSHVQVGGAAGLRRPDLHGHHVAVAEPAYTYKQLSFLFYRKRKLGSEDAEPTCT